MLQPSAFRFGTLFFANFNEIVYIHFAPQQLLFTIVFGPQTNLEAA